VAVIQAGRTAGIPLASIARALALLPADRPPSKRDWARLSRSWRRDVEERIALLERVRDDLASCIGCGCLSLRACRLFNPVDRAADAGAGARYLLGDEPPADILAR
jgi:MerR family redox-sensitive transcriptional activator SoxR